MTHRPLSETTSPDTREYILDRWALGETMQNISCQVGFPASRVLRIVHRARSKGDKRADPHGPGPKGKAREITLKMIKAGVMELASFDSRVAEYDDLAVWVYEAMERARRGRRYD